MNRQLIEQFETQASEDILGVKVLDKKMFAELIVRECVTRVQGCHLAEGYDPSIVGEFELGYKKGIDKATTQMLKHFGLE